MPLDQIVQESLLARVRAALGHAGVDCGSRLLVGFSGGPDSLCLLAVLCHFRHSPLSLRLHALHVDHGLRRDSAAEADRAAELAWQLGVPYEITRLAASRRTTGNLQQWAREQRLAAFADAAKRRRCSHVALGHTADDQAETVLMRALRGSGLRGLAAMRANTRVVVSAGHTGTLNVLRPLLKVQRDEIEAWLAANELQPLRDPSNEGDAYLRNRVRRRVMPLLRQENPRIVSALARLAENCAEESDLIDALTKDSIQRIQRDGFASASELRNLAPALLHRVIAGWHAGQCINGYTLGRGHIASAAEMIARQDSARWTLSLPGACLVGEYDQVRLVPRRGPGRPRLSTGSPADQPTLVGPELLGNSWQLIGGEQSAIKMRVVDDATEDRFALGLHLLRFPLVLRCVRPGDRIAIAYDQHKPVSRVLAEARIPSAQRAKAKVIESGQQVVLVVGLRRAFGFRPEPLQSALLVNRA